MSLFTKGRFLRSLITPPLLPHFRRSLQTRNSLSIRLNPTPSTRNESSLSTNTSSTPLLEQMEPKLFLTFTCTVSDCDERSTHQFTKHAYQKGVVLVQCPGCKNRHLIADHLGWFKESTQDGKVRTIEDHLLLDRSNVFLFCTEIMTFPIALSDSTGMRSWQDTLSDPSPALVQLRNATGYPGAWRNS